MVSTDECHVTFKPCFRNCDRHSSATCWSLFLGQLLLSFCLLLIARIKHRNGDRGTRTISGGTSIWSTVVSGFSKVTATIASGWRIRRRGGSNKNQESLLKEKEIFGADSRDRDIISGKNQKVLGDESFQFPINIASKTNFDTKNGSVKEGIACKVQDEKDSIISNHQADCGDTSGSSSGIDDKEEFGKPKRRVSILKDEKENSKKINKSADGGSGLDVIRANDKPRRRTSVVRFKGDQSIKEIQDPNSSEHSIERDSATKIQLNGNKVKLKALESKEPFLPDIIENGIDKEVVSSIYIYPNRQSSEGEIDISSHLDLSGSESISEDSLRNDQLSLTSELMASVKSRHQKNPVLRTWRSHLNFCKTNDDPFIRYPSPYSPEYVPLEQDSSLSLRVLKSILDQKETLGITISSLGYAFFTSALSSLLVILSRYEDAIYQNCPESADNFSYREWIQGNGATIRITLDGYKFLPIFLLLGYMGFLVNRWRMFLATCHSIQGRIHDIGLLCGSVPTIPVKEASKEKIWNIYRYLNVVHILCLKSFSPSLKDLVIESDYVTELGLLTEDEATTIAMMEIKARDGVLTLLAHATAELFQGESNFNQLEDNNYNRCHAANVAILDQICRLRGTCSQLHDLFVRDNPNEYIVSMQALTIVYAGLVVVGFPLIMQSYASDAAGCVQPAAFIGSFLMLMSLSFPLVLFKKLQNPFAENGIEVDNLIASTELCLFQNMRCLWHFGLGAGIGKSTSFAKFSRRNRFGLGTKGTYGEL